MEIVTSLPGQEKRYPAHRFDQVQIHRGIVNFVRTLDPARSRQSLRRSRNIGIIGRSELYRDRRCFRVRYERRGLGAPRRDQSQQREAAQDIIPNSHSPSSKTVDLNHELKSDPYRANHRYTLWIGPRRSSQVIGPTSNWPLRTNPVSNFISA